VDVRKTPEASGFREPTTSADERETLPHPATDGTADRVTSAGRAPHDDESEILSRMPSMSFTTTAQALAIEIRNMIVDGQLPPGTLLPNERTFAEQTQIGRSSVREALRILEHQGLVRTRRGKGGGTRVTQPGLQSVVGPLKLFIQSNSVSLDSLLQVRQVVEPACAALAAKHRSAFDLDALLSYETAMRIAHKDGDQRRFLDANYECLLEAIGPSIREKTEFPGLDIEAREATIRAHAKILRAIKEEKDDAAFRSMERHIIAYAEMIVQEELDF
jgi:GntR family transcriptional repressor for pyruvate dehydrogenase complex